MGMKYEFNCPGCGYKESVSGGGDAGMRVNTTNILCEDCKRLYDVVTFDNLHGESVRKEPKCEIGESHKIRLWKHPDVCPRCGIQMRKGRWTMIWD